MQGLPAASPLAVLAAVSAVTYATVAVVFFVMAVEVLRGAVREGRVSPGYAAVLVVVVAACWPWVLIEYAWRRLRR